MGMAVIIWPGSAADQQPMVDKSLRLLACYLNPENNTAKQNQYLSIFS
jgi:hypothetical protein